MQITAAKGQRFNSENLESSNGRYLSSPQNGVCMFVTFALTITLNTQILSPESVFITGLQMG